MRDIILADKQDITRVGIEFLICENEDKVKFHYTDNKTLLIRLLVSHPDALVVLDYSLFDFVGVDDLLNVSARFPNSHWLLFSEELSADFLKRLLFSSESFSIILKNCDLIEINSAIIHAFRNERFICQRVTNQILLSNKSTKSKSENVLTATEIEILKEIALGRTTKEIAAARNLSFHTVITHRKNIFRKLEVNNVHEATKYAMRAGIIDVADYYI